MYTSRHRDFETAKLRIACPICRSLIKTRKLKMKHEGEGESGMNGMRRMGYEEYSRLHGRLPLPQLFLG